MMLCGVVVLSNCACIWINCSRRLLLDAVDPEVELALPEALDELGAVVIDTLEPSA